MDYFVIEVPDMNDSVVKVSLQSRLYQLRFTWNDTGGYWMLGVMDSLGTPLLLGVKMVPQFPLNLLFGRDDAIELTAVSSGGSQAMFFKLNTLGENAFLDRLREIVEQG